MATTNWTVAAGGSFGSDIGWSTTHHPVVGDTANINSAFLGVAYDVTVSDTQAASVINVGAANAELAISGLLTVGTINMNAGSLAVVGGGTIAGNTTIVAKSGTTFRAQDGTLDGVTWRGALNLTGVTQSSLLTVTSSLKVLNEAGTAPGVINITGQGASLNIANSMTLDGTTGTNLQINLGFAGSGIEFLAVGSGDVLTLGSNVTVSQTAAASDVRIDDVSTNGAVVNKGTLSFTAGAGAAAGINLQNFTNAGVINVDGGVKNGESLDITSFDSFTQSATGLISVTDFGRVGISTTITPGHFVLNGLISATGAGTVDLNNNATGSGDITLAGSSTADIFNYTGTVTFLDATGTLALEQPGSYTGTVVGLSSIGLANDVIDLLHTQVTGFAPYVGTALGGTLTVMNGVDVAATIQLVGNYTNTQFGMGTDGNAGTDIFVMACFASGTRIATPAGDVAVEDLQTGQDVLTAEGDVVAISWLGHRHVNCRHHPDPSRVWPVRVRAGAFGEGRPYRDLWLSPDHAVFVDDVLIPIRVLINGTSIIRVPMDEVTYHHVELPRHELLLAEGLPVESYLDRGDRSGFADAGAVVRLFPAFGERGPDHAGLWEALGRAPLIVSGPKCDAARRFLRANAAAMSRNRAGSRVSGS